MSCDIVGRSGWVSDISAVSIGEDGDYTKLARKLNMPATAKFLASCYADEKLSAVMLAELNATKRKEFVELRKLLTADKPPYAITVEYVKNSLAVKID